MKQSPVKKYLKKKFSKRGKKPSMTSLSNLSVVRERRNSLVIFFFSYHFFIYDDLVTYLS